MTHVHVQASDLRALVKLTTLDISHNQLRAIDDDMLTGAHLCNCVTASTHCNLRRPRRPGSLEPVAQSIHRAHCAQLAIAAQAAILARARRAPIGGTARRERLQSAAVRQHCCRLFCDNAATVRRNLRELSLYNLGATSREGSLNVRGLLSNLPPMNSLLLEIADATLATQLYSIDWRFVRSLARRAMRACNDLFTDALMCAVDQRAAHQARRRRRIPRVARLRGAPGSDKHRARAVARGAVPYARPSDAAAPQLGRQPAHDARAVSQQVTAYILAPFDMQTNAKLDKRHIIAAP